MQEIRFNSPEFNNYLSQHGIQLTNEKQVALGSIFDECNVVLENDEKKEDRRLTGSEISLFLIKIKDKFRDIFKIFNSRESFGQNLIDRFNNEYPEVKSSTYLASVARDLERKGAPQDVVKKLFTEADSLDYNDKNNKNCEERAWIIDSYLDDENYSGRKAVVVIHGEQNLDEGYSFGNHVLNIIGLAPDADISNPATWGENAVIVDSWANKVMKPQEAIEYYRDFLGYNAENQPLFFEELNAFYENIRNY